MANFQSYKGSNSSALHSPLAVKALAITATGKEVSSGAKTPITRLIPTQVEEYRRKNLCFKCDEQIYLWAQMQEHKSHNDCDDF